MKNPAYACTSASWQHSGKAAHLHLTERGSAKLICCRAGGGSPSQTERAATKLAAGTGRAGGPGRYSVQNRGLRAVLAAPQCCHPCSRTSSLNTCAWGHRQAAGSLACAGCTRDAGRGVSHPGPAPALASTGRGEASPGQTRSPLRLCSAPARGPGPSTPPSWSRRVLRCRCSQSRISAPRLGQPLPPAAAGGAQGLQDRRSLGASRAEPGGGCQGWPGRAAPGGPAALAGTPCARPPAPRPRRVGARLCTPAAAWPGPAAWVGPWGSSGRPGLGWRGQKAAPTPPTSLAGPCARSGPSSWDPLTEICCRPAACSAVLPARQSRAWASRSARVSDRLNAG